MMSQNIENVVKQGYLKKGHYGANRLSVLFRRNDVNKWFVFTIRRGVPFLEYYDSDVDVFTQQPINSFNLSRCQNVRSMGNMNPPSFCIVCPDRVIELVASSRAQMVEWVNEVEASLIRLGILKNEVIDHVYSVCPAVVRKPRVSMLDTDEKESEASSCASSVDTSELRHSIDAVSQTVSSSSSLPIPPPRSSQCKQRTLSFKPAPRASLASRTSSSFHASCHSAATVEMDGPPPLPARLSSCIDKTSSRTESEKTTVSGHRENSSAHATTDGSNDSDFVSPEVIAELRLQRKTAKKMLNSQTLDPENEVELTHPENEVELTHPENEVELTHPENEVELTSATLADTCSDIYIDMCKPHVDHNTKVSCSPSPSQQSHLMTLTLEPLQISTEASDMTDSSENLDNDSVACMSSSQCADSIDVFIRPEDVVENTYSVFPCQQESADGVIDDSNLVESAVSHIAKPTPVPRKAVPKVFSPAVCDPLSKPLSVADEQTNTAVSVSVSQQLAGEEIYNNLLPADGTYSNLHANGDCKSFVSSDDCKNFVSGDDCKSFVSSDDCKSFVSGDDGTSVLAAGDTYRNLHASDCEIFVSSDAGTSVLAADSDTAVEYDNCKDEYISLQQENKYNNVLNVEKDNKTVEGHSHLPSVKDSDLHPSKDENENVYGLVFEPGPPTTIAPPIPPLPSGHYSHPARCYSNQCSTGQEHRSTSSSVNVTNSPSSTLPPSAFHAAASNKYTGLPNEYIPPLPLPRKTNSHPFRASLAGSNITSNEFRDVPHKASRLHHAMSLDDQPPALPSRNSQSFFIKRPQITGMSSNKINSSDSNNSQTNTDPKPNQPSLSTENKCPDTEVAANVSNLSRKMLLDRAHSLHTVVSLKQTQAEILQTEIAMPNVNLTITQKAGHGIALVDWNSFACVVGWNQKDFPSLHGKLHLGDLIFSVNSVRVTGAETAQKLLKQAPSSNIELMLHRMPYAKVFAIHRNTEGQSLGIKRNGGTGEIVYVDPNGLAAQHGLTAHAQSVCAAQHGLTAHAQSVCASGRCNWFLVEINNRPLSFFFKEEEIDHRLSAVGREISLVVQPSDFIYEIRRQFKKLRNYKQYITQ